MTQSPELPRKLMLLIAAIQGILLLFLYDASESGTWPSESPLWNFPLWTIAIMVPVLLLLSLEKGLELRAAKLIGAFAVLLIALAIYIGWQASPYDAFPIGNLAFAFIWSIGLACFKALMYLQQRAAEKPMTYDVLFTYSWRNSLTLALSLLLVFVFWLILLLWANLFRAIEIDFFHDLFRETWFVFPVLSVAHGVGVIIFRNLTRVIDSITRLFEGLIKILLPLAAVVSVVFLAALPFVGLDVLWATGRGTSLLLWLLAVILFFTNAVYQDGRGERPYPLILHRILYVALLTTPVISALSFYGLYLRLEEYGWTVIRGWAFIVWLVLTLFSVGYVIGIARKRDEWTQDLAKVNTGMGLVVMVLMLLLNSPLMDLRKLSLNSQLNRLESGELQIEDFDFWYVKQSLGRPGYLFMEEKKAEIGDSDPDLLALIEKPRPRNDARRLQSTEELWVKMIYRPDTFDVPNALRTKINMDIPRMAMQVQPVLVRIDLDGDEQDEYVLIHAYENHLNAGRMYFLENGDWSGLNLSNFPGYLPQINMIDKITDGEISVIEHRFGMLKIDDQLIRPMEEE